jgi:CRISPR/Cas system CMR-associated protein Cmr5 small subunit
MTEKTIEVTEKESTREPFEIAENHVDVTEDQEVQAATEGQKLHVESHVWWFKTRPEEAAPETFTREVFEGTLDKVSRPLKGRFAHVPYTSDDLIRDKRTEVELEDS